jgi:hypothetical protein
MMSRFMALLIGTLALAALRGQFDALPYAPLADKLWAMAGHYAVLTGLGVAGLMFAVAKSWRMGGATAAAMLGAVALVAFAFALRVWGHAAIAFGWADYALHLGLPLAVALWWWLFADKTLTGRDLPRLIAWPAVFGLYTLVRGVLACGSVVCALGLG